MDAIGIMKHGVMGVPQIIQNYPKLDYLSIESHGDLGIPHFKKAPYRRMTKHCCPMDLRFSSVSYPKFSPPPAVSSV